MDKNIQEIEVCIVDKISEIGLDLTGSNIHITFDDYKYLIFKHGINGEFFATKTDNNSENIQ